MDDTLDDILEALSELESDHSANWRRGDLTFLLHDGQKKLKELFNTAPGKLFVGNLSRQWGKSYWAVTVAIECALSGPKKRIKYATAFQTDLLEFILPAFEKVLETCPEDLAPKKVGSKYKFQNGSEIQFVGLDRKPNGLRGNSIDLIVVDECGFVGNLDYLYKSVIVPTMLHRPQGRIIFISTPPDSLAHPFGQYIQKARAAGAYVEMDIYTNPLITQADIDALAEELGGVESTEFKREALCQLVTDPTKMIIPEWNSSFVKDTPKPEHYALYHKYNAMDLGVIDFTTNLYGYYDFKRAILVIEDESDMRGPTMTTDKLVDLIKKKEMAIWGNEAIIPVVAPKVHRRIADNNNPLLLLDMTTLHSLTFHPTDKDNLHAMVNEVRLLVKAGRIEVNPRCKNLIACLEFGIWDKNKKEFDRSQIYGHFDWLAALVYLVRNLDQHTNPIPFAYGANQYEQMIKTEQQKKTHHQIQRLFKRSS